MEPNRGKVRLYRDGLVANDIHLVLKKWIIEKENFSSILDDNTTYFSSLRNVVGTKDISQCRKLLGLQDNVDLALIFIITMTSTRFVNRNVVTSWIGSDLQDSCIKIIIKGGLTPELREAGVGTVCAILNPNVKEQVVASDLKTIDVKQPDEILIIGQVDGLKLCKGITSKGEMCKNLVYVHNQGDYCKYHLKFAKKIKRTEKIQKIDNDDKTHLVAKLERIDKENENRIENNKENRETNNNKNKTENIKNIKIDGVSQKEKIEERKRDTNKETNKKILEVNTNRVRPTLIEPEFKPYAFVEPSKPVRSIDTMYKLGDLNFLMQKIVSTRSVSNTSTASTALPPVTRQEPPVPRKVAVVESSREFEELSELVKDYSTKGSKLYNKMLGTLQIMTRKLNGVTNDVVNRTQIMKTCDLLLDHPLENIAISALKLRRAIKKSVKPHSLEKDGQYRVTGENTGYGKNKNEKTMPQKSKKQVLEELDSLIGLSSNVESFVDKEKGIDLTRKLVDIEKLDMTNEFKQTIQFVEVYAHYCHECKRWYENISNLCTQEKHKLTKERVKKERHYCVNKQCKYGYYSLNGQKPVRCPKCKESTVVSSKTTFYEPRPDYSMPNEKLFNHEHSVTTVNFDS